MYARNGKYVIAIFIAYECENTMQGKKKVMLLIKFHDKHAIISLWFAPLSLSRGLEASHFLSHHNFAYRPSS